MELRGKNVWLIGASTGIGAELVPKLVAQGARLAISSRSDEQLHELAARHGRGDAPIAVHPLDVTEPGAIDRVEAQLRAAWGSIDVLIYNAGTWAPVDVDAWDVQAFESMIAVNYTGMMRAIAAVLPDMLARRGGEIVGVGSLSAYGAFPRGEAYGSTKAAVNYLLQALRFDVAKRGVGVTTVNPGFVKTRLTETNDFPMPFLLKPEQAARAIVKGMLAGHTEIHFPLRLSVPLKLLTALPRPLYEWLAVRVLKD
jgi:short-subunit dehydrogenase